jgi:hypothetical protein
VDNESSGQGEQWTVRGSCNALTRKVISQYGWWSIGVKGNKLKLCSALTRKVIVKVVGGVRGVTAKMELDGTVHQFNLC